MMNEVSMPMAKKRTAGRISVMPTLTNFRLPASHRGLLGINWRWTRFMRPTSRSQRILWTEKKKTSAMCEPWTSISIIISPNPIQFLVREIPFDRNGCNWHGNNFNFAQAALLILGECTTDGLISRFLFQLIRQELGAHLFDARIGIIDPSFVAGRYDFFVVDPH